MATAKVDEELLEGNIAYFKDTLMQIQCPQLQLGV